MMALFFLDIKRGMSVRNIIIAVCFFILMLFMFLLSKRGIGTRKDFSGVKDHVSIGIINNDTSDYSKMLVDYFKENKSFTEYVDIYVGDEKDIVKSYSSGDIDMYLVIPAGFADSMYMLKNLDVTAVISPENTAKALILKNMLESYNKYISAVEVNSVALRQAMEMSGMDDELNNNINDKVSLKLVVLALSKSLFFEMKAVDEFKPVGMVRYYCHEAVFLLLVYIGMLSGIAVISEHSSGMINRIRVTGLSTEGYMFEKAVIFSVPMALISMALSYIIHCFGYSHYNLMLILYYLILSFFISSFFVFAASLFKAMANYILFSNMFIILGAVIGGGMIPLQYMPQSMLKFSGLSLNYWFMKTVYNTEKVNLAKNENVPYFLMLALLMASALLCALAAYFYVNGFNFLKRRNQNTIIGG